MSAKIRRQRPKNWVLSVNTDNQNRLDKVKITGDLTAQEQFTYQAASQDGLTSSVAISAGEFSASDLFRLINERFIDFISLIDYINTIDTINTINTISNIANIQNIASMPQISSSPNIMKNGSFLSNTLSGWDLVGNGAALDLIDFAPTTVCILPPHPITPSFIGQNLSAYTATNFFVSFYAKSLNGTANNLILGFTFSDYTTETKTYTVGNILWVQYFYNPVTQGKKLLNVSWENQTNDTVWLNQFVGVICNDDNSSAPSGATVVIPKAVGKITITPYINTNGTAETVTLYTVPANKTFYLCGAFLSYTASGAGGNCFMLINGVNWIVTHASVAGSLALTYPLTVPLPFPAGTVFAIESDNVNLVSYGSLIGWTE